MNLVLLEPADFPQGITGPAPLRGEAEVRGRRAKHIREVHRVRPRDVLRVGLVDSLLGEGEVLQVDRDEVRLKVELTEPPPEPSGIALALAMPRPKVLRRLLSQVASMGLKKVVVVRAARVEESYFDSPLVAPDAVHKALLLGLEQARDTRLPEVEIGLRFQPFVGDQVPSRWPGPVPKLVAHPAGERLLEACPVGREPDPVLVAVGPEGGFVPFEVELLERTGFCAFSLGPRILRVETAVPALVGQLDLLRRHPIGRT